MSQPVSHYSKDSLHSCDPGFLSYHPEILSYTAQEPPQIPFLKRKNKGQLLETCGANDFKATKPHTVVTKTLEYDSLSRLTHPGVQTVLFPSAPLSLPNA